MKVKIMVASVGLVCYYSTVIQCWKVFSQNNVLDKDFTSMSSDGSALKPEFYDDLSTGPEKLPIEIIQLEKNSLEEDEEIKKSSDSGVDEETIRKAEKMANKDLLNGLKRILKNNETLKDVFGAENVFEIP